MTWTVRRAPGVRKSDADAQRRSRALVPRGPEPTMATWTLVDLYDLVPDTADDAAGAVACGMMMAFCVLDLNL